MKTKTKIKRKVAELKKEAIGFTKMILLSMGFVSLILIPSVIANWDKYGKTIVIENVAEAPEELQADICGLSEVVCDHEYDGVASVSAYNAEEGQTDGDPFTMASTKKVYEGAVACPGKYEFGTKIEIEGVGTVICEDRMNIRYRDGEYFDIFMFSYLDAIKFGRKELRYKVL